MSDQVVTKFGDGSSGPVRLGWYCPGCREAHLIPVGPSSPPPSWDWDGARDRPTLSPSIRIRFERHGRDEVCHSFVRDGVVEFLSDCTHELAGLSVPMLSKDANPFLDPAEAEP